MTKSVNTPAKTPIVAAKNPMIKIFAHWILAAAILFLFVSSWWMLSLPLPSAEYTYRVLPFQLHKNIGMTLFALIFVMIVMRISNQIRTQSEANKFVNILAMIDQWCIYFLVASSCVSGYLSSSYSGWDTELWWLVQLPAWATENDKLNIVFSDVHQFSCWLLLLAVVIHIAGALYHGLKDDKQLDKMFP